MRLNIPRKGRQAKRTKKMPSRVRVTKPATHITDPALKRTIARIQRRKTLRDKRNEQKEKNVFNSLNWERQWKAIKESKKLTLAQKIKDETRLIEQMIDKTEGSWLMQNWQKVEERLLSELLQHKNGKQLTGKEINELLQKNVTYTFDSQERHVVDKATIYWLRKQLSQFNHRLPIA